MNSKRTFSSLLLAAFTLFLIAGWIVGGEITAQTTQVSQPASGIDSTVTDPNQIQRMLALQQQIIQYNAIVDYLEYRLNLANAAVDYRAGLPPMQSAPAAAPAGNSNNSGMPLVGSDRTRRNRNSESKNPLNIGTTIPKIKRVTRDANGDMIIEYDNQVINTTPNTNR